jgi:hypothetical protein
VLITPIVGQDSGSTVATVSLVLAIETTGLVLGAAAGCAMRDSEGRWFPTASSVIVGGVGGGAAGFGMAYWLISARGIDNDTDNPIASVGLILLGVTGGAFGGGYLSYRLDRWLRPLPGEDLALQPMVEGGGMGVSLTGRF